MIIALAGHVDHGKTALIRALTGIDTDRLPEEKQRGMTIDLGFAHCVLPGGARVGFVDVPGHERFLGNMLAGVLSIDTVLLAIAADDGPMPQTREHLAVLRLTGVTDIAVALTKIDRVDAARLAAARAEVAALLDAPAMEVSSVTGDGIDALRAFIVARAESHERRTTAGGFRLAIDRSFSATGTGLVVTGTVAAGKVSVGDRLLLSPSRLAARVRGIQVHHEAAESAQAGDRCALAITGPRVEKARLKRGDWLIDPDLHAPTLRIDALVAAVAGKVLKHASRVHVHIGAAGLAGRMLIAGPEGFVTLALERQAVCLYGDRLILRDDSSGRVIAGGHVIDPFPPERRVRRETRALSLQALALPDPAEAFRALLAAEGWAASRRFIQARNLAADFAPEMDAIRIGPATNPISISAATIDALRARLLAHLRIWHEAHPEQMGPGKAELARGAGSVPAEIAEAVIGVLLEQSDILRDGLAFRLPAHRPVLPPLDAARWIRVRAMLIAADLRPPRVREVATAMVLEPGETETLLIRLERFGLLVRVAPNRFFLPETVVNLGFSAAELAAGTEEAGFTAAEFNKRTGIGRNLTIQVLEHLDAIGVTSRAGDLRHVVRSVQDAVG